MTIKAQKMNPADFDPTQRAFPFVNTPHPDAMGVTELSPGVFLGRDGRAVTFALQRGPVREVGHNGCDITDMLEFTRLTLEAFQAKFACRENAIAITKMQEAEMWLRERTRDREERGVEGTSTK